MIASPSGGAPNENRKPGSCRADSRAASTKRGGAWKVTMTVMVFAPLRGFVPRCTATTCGEATAAAANASRLRGSTPCLVLKTTDSCLGTVGGPPSAVVEDDFLSLQADAHRTCYLLIEESRLAIERKRRLGDGNLKRMRLGRNRVLDSQRRRWILRHVARHRR